MKNRCERCIYWRPLGSFELYACHYALVCGKARRKRAEECDLGREKDDGKGICSEAQSL